MSSDKTPEEKMLRYAVSSGKGFFDAEDTEAACRWAIAEIDRLRADHARFVSDSGSTVPLAEEWPDGTIHDYRCNGECPRCQGADACGMVGMSCYDCTGECAKKTGARLDGTVPHA